MFNIKRDLIIILLCFFLFYPVLAISGERSVIVGFHKKPGPSERALVRRSNSNIKKTFHLIPAMVASLTEKEIEKLRKDKKVAYIEDDALFMTADDQYISAWGVSHIGAEAVHTGTNKGLGIKIAVIDTGIDYNHDDLDDNFIDGINFVQTSAAPADPLTFFDDNTKSHGTHVSGIIAAEDNLIGVVGVAPEASLYAVRVLDGGGFGLVSWIISGIEWAVDNGMDIANISIQGPHVQSLQAACDAAYDSGLLLIAAGGNYVSGGGGPVKYPAAYDSVLAVTATDALDARGYLSPDGSELELAAPGIDIYSTVTAVNGSYGLLSGTSQAAPHVTGTAALFFSTSPVDVNGNGMIHDEVRDMLNITALDLGVTGFDDVFGYGLVNAAAVSNGFDCPDSDGDGYVACYGICDPGAFSCGECDDSDENVNPLALELCDGIDNNCDGSADEGFPDVGTSCTEGVGACEVIGSYFCTPDQVTECDAVPGTPGAEGPVGESTCNDTIDNDCDGMTDDLDPDCGGEILLPPVRQSIGIFDGDFSNLQEADCRLCHESSVDPTSNVDRHHLLYGQLIPEGSIVPDPDADNDSVPDVNYGCLNCHEQDTSGDIITFIVVRDCLECHQQTPHHETEQALAGDCVYCHGDIVDNMDDGHIVRAYEPTLVTPDPSGGGGEPFNNRGNGAGACNYCHDSDGLETPVIKDNMTAHHSTGLAQCLWCHQDSSPPNDAYDIRTCEGCHGLESLHNIQTDSDGDGIIEVGGETNFGYGHIGRDAGPGDSDCWGCHGFITASATGSGPVIPSVASSDVPVMTAGEDTQITLNGSAFTNLAGTVQWTSDVLLTASDGSSTILTPDAITEGTLTVTVPGTMQSGNYTLQVVKDDVGSNPVALSITPELMVADVECSKCLAVMTVTGSGFGEKPEGVDDYINLEESGRPLDVISWTDTIIKAAGARCRGTVDVNALFGSAAYEQE